MGDRRGPVRVKPSRLDVTTDAVVEAFMRRTPEFLRAILKEQFADLAPAPRRGPVLVTTDEDRARAEVADEVTRQRARAILDRATRRSR